MSNTSMSASHQVSISHDPLEEHRSAGTDQLRARRDNWPSGGRRVTWQPSSGLGSFDVSGLRPALLAGAIGLFAAWLVSGMNGKTRHGGRYVADREEPRRFGQRPQQTRGPRTGYSAAGPEGRSSREEFELDAMNP